MEDKKKLKKRYLFSLLGILFAIISVLFLRSCDIDFERKKLMTTKELKAILDLNTNLYVDKQISNTTVKDLRNAVANRISYKKLFDTKSDFKNFENIEDKDVYGFQLENRVHVGFYQNFDKCIDNDGNSNYCIGIIVDLNGYTRPNKMGQDQYLLKVYKNIVNE